MDCSVFTKLAKFTKANLSRSEIGFLAIIAAYILGCYGLTYAAGFAGRFQPIMYLGTAAQMSITFALAYVGYRLLRAVVFLIIHKPKKPIEFTLDDLKQGPLRADPYMKAVPIMIGFIFFFSSFTSMKYLIADIRPFMWDEFFMRADSLIHFGRDPWALLQPILGYRPVTKLISFVYILWLPIFLMVLYWQLFQLEDLKMRMRFFYTFVLSWGINGTFLAIFFSSAGPCFYDFAAGSEHYAPLMDYLYEINTHTKVYALKTQEMLLANHMGQGNLLGGGISAFPSVHVATAFLFVLVSKQSGKFIHAGFIAFFTIILLGSIHLGWHYAVDGYFSILTTWSLWWISGKLVKRLS